MKYKLLMICWALCGLNTMAQQLMPQEIPTPQAASLGKYGNIPMSYYTGRANITIPLYNFTFRGVTLPVYLSYDCSGLQPNSLPGWTGQNWTLNAGGVITRVTQGGFNDEYKYPSTFYFSPGTFYNYFQSCGAIDRLYTNANNYAALLDSVKFKKVDLAPDIFHFNFMGITGRFFLGSDGEWKVDCNQNIEVIFDYNDENNFIEPFISKFPSINTSAKQPKTIKGFLLRDENGNKYYFGGSTNSIEYRTEFFRMSSSEEKVAWTANSWYLTKVTDRHDNVLYELFYNRGAFMAQILNSIEAILVNNNSSWWVYGNYGNSYQYSNSYFPYHIEMNSPLYMSTIRLADGRFLSFEYTSYITTKTLYTTTLYYNINERIQSLCGNNMSNQFFYLQTDVDSIKRYQVKTTPDVRSSDPLSATGIRLLKHIYFSTSNDGNANYSFVYDMGAFPMLKAVRHMDTSSIHGGSNPPAMNQYVFKYYQQDQLPAGHLTTAVDHWGYYNGNSYITPSGSNYDFSNFKQIRNSNSSYAKRGLLKEIIYPTGGSTEFQYESNDYSGCMSADRQTLINTSGYAGGLRISSITDYADSLHSEILQTRTFQYNIPGTSQSSGQLFADPCYYWPDWTPKDANGNYSIHLSYFRSASIVPLSNSFGPHVGYSYVKETLMDGSSILYHYTNIADRKDLRPIYDNNDGAVSPFDVYCERGYGRGKLLRMTIYDGNGLKKRETAYTYRTDNTDSLYVLSSNMCYENNGNSATFAHYNGGIYKLFYPKYDVIQETTTTYFNQDSIVDQRNYNKSDYHLMADYEGWQHQVDIRKLNAEALTRKSDTYYTSYLYPFEESGQVYQNMYRNQFFIPVIKKLHYYNNTLCNMKTTTYNLFSGMILPEFEIEAKNGQESDTLVHYLNYTNRGVPYQYRKKDGTLVTLNWHNNDLYLQGITTGTNHTTSCTYDNRNRVTSITQPNGNVTNYTYDDFGKLTEIKDKYNKFVKKFTYQYQNK